LPAATNHAADFAITPDVSDLKPHGTFCNAWLNRIALNECIKPEEWNRNNWTMVLATPWY